VFSRKKLSPAKSDNFAPWTNEMNALNLVVRKISGSVISGRAEHQASLLNDPSSTMKVEPHALSNLPAEGSLPYIRDVFPTLLSIEPKSRTILAAMLQS
jgi:hypothetical protein